MLAGSLILTPLISKALFSGGISEAAGKLSGVAIGAGAYTVGKVANLPPARKAINGLKGVPGNLGGAAMGKYRMHKDNQAIKQNPRLRYEPQNLPSAVREQKREEKHYQKMDRQEIRKSPYKKYVPESLPSYHKKNKG